MNPPTLAATCTATLAATFVALTGLATTSSAQLGDPTERFSPEQPARAIVQQLQPLTVEARLEVSRFFNPTTPEDIAAAIGVNPPPTTRNYQIGYVIAPEQRGRLRPAPEELVRQLPTLHGPNLRYFIVDDRVLAINGETYRISDSMRIAPVGHPIPADTDAVTTPGNLYSGPAVTPARSVDIYSLEGATGSLLPERPGTVFTPEVQARLTDYFALFRRSANGLPPSLVGTVPFEEVPIAWITNTPTQGTLVSPALIRMLVPATPEVVERLPRLIDPDERYFIMGANLVILNTRTNQVVEALHLATVRSQR